MKASEHIVEEWLVLNCQHGDREALELLIKRWQPKMMRRVYHTTKDVSASQDIVQDAWITIIKGIKTLKDPRSFEWWSLRIATNKAIDWIRSNQLSRKRERIREEAQQDFMEDASGPSDELLLLLGSAIRELPEEQRVVIEMFYRENLSVLKIGLILSVPTGTVKSRLFKGREKLKKLLKTKK